MTERAVAEELPPSYARWRASRLGQITDELENRLVFELLGPANATLLDAGCGDGLMAVELARRGARVVALDADPAMVVAARSRAARKGTPLHVVTGRIEALPFADAIFDRVLAVTVLCFAADAERAVAEMARVLKPGGRLVLGELGRRSWWAAHRRLRGWLGAPVWRAAGFRSARELRRLAGGAGLEVTELRGGVYYPPCALAARLFASFDAWLGRRTTLGAAFIAMSATKPSATAPMQRPCGHPSLR